MKLYYATPATDDALDDIMQHGIRRTDDAPVVLLTETPDLAACVAVPDRRTVEMFVFSVALPPDEKIILPPQSAISKGLPVYGYPGDIPPDWIPGEYTTTKLTASDAEVD